MTLIGDAIKRRREQSGMTRQQVAEQIRMSDSYVTSVENGVRVPPIESMLLFANLWSDVDSVQWAWFVVRGRYGDELAKAMWKYARREQPAPPASTARRAEAEPEQ